MQAEQAATPKREQRPHSVIFYVVIAVIFSMLISVTVFGVPGVIIAASLVAIVGIVHEEIYRKRFLSAATDDDLDRFARAALLEKRVGDS